MKTIVLALVLAALLGGYAQPARADYEDGTHIPQEVIAPLMAWVEQQVGVRVPVLPNVVASREQLTEIVSHMGRLAGRARALYIGGMVIVDNDAFDPEDSTQISLLVHELVHYAQSFKRVSVWSCAQEKEVEAYTLQNKWLEEQGHAAFVSASWIKRASSCPTTATAMAMASAD